MNNKVSINYAVYGLDLNASPFIRFNNIEDAKAELTNSDDAAIIITEVCEEIDGKLIIVQERVISAPIVWIPLAYLPECDGHYLCHLVRKVECGNFLKWQEVIEFSKGKWVISEHSRITHWINIPPPPKTIIKI